MSKRKSKPVQSAMFNQGEELPIFTQSQYGAVVAPFVPAEEGKRAAMFRATFAELAEAEQKRRDRRAFMLANKLDEPAMARQVTEE
jgi:hypothetical protein